jgi:PAS domain S-box-containing protein
MSGVMADITQRKKTEQALRESEERYRTLVENLNEGIFVIKEGKIEFINPRSLDFTGYSETELTSASFLNFVHPEDRNMVIERHAQRMRGDLSPYQYPVRVLTREGETKCLLVQSRVIPWQGDIATLISATDITQLKAAEKALRESETQLRTLVQAVPGVVYLKDGDGRWLQANEEGLGIFELQDFDYKGKSEPELAEHAVKYRDALLTCKETDERAWLERKPVRADEIIPTPDGSERVFDIAKVPLFHPDGRRNGIVVVGLDVTARKKAEDALREQFEIQRALLSTIPAYVFFKDRDLRFITANKHLSDLTGIPEHEFLGKTDYDILPKDNADLCRKSDLQVIETGTPLMNQEEMLTDPDDKKMWLSTTKAPFYDSEGKIAGLVGISIDVTDRKRSDELLLQAERFRAVADLAAGVAHNFNNLLQIVIGNLELALMDLDMGDHINVRDEIRRVLESSRFGAETVRRLQSFAGIRDHTQISEKGAFDLSQITDQAIEMCKTWWKTIPEKSGIKITLNRELQDNCSVLCEKNEIFDVVVNLIKNAVEAMPEGGTINVLTGVQGDWVSLKISDTGIGISETNRKRIFNPFFTTKAFAGSGLGLASSRKIVQEYGGTILVDSTEGKGTTFTVLIPLAREERKDRGNSQLPIIPQNLKILAIDDEQPVLDLLKNALRRTNCELFTANSGAEGLELWNSGSFDLVICDLGMPGMNGWDVAKQIKCLSNDRKIAKTPFILLTGWGGQKTETEKIAENGVDVVLEKPLNIMAMFEIVREVVERCRN